MAVLQAVPSKSASLELSGSKKNISSEGWSDFDTCASPGSAAELARLKRQDSASTDAPGIRTWLVSHQISMVVSIFLSLGAAHILLPDTRPWIRKLFELQYANPGTDSFLQGPDDFMFVACWSIILTGMRAASMSYFLLPAAQLLGVAKLKQRIRFAEQGWLLLYYTASFSLGMYIMYHSDYWLNLRALWSNFPTRTMDFTLKWYYLVQFAFYLQQILVVNIEEPRKDYWQMLTHHVITSILMLTSYASYQTKVGVTIMVCMDVVDTLLPTAKLLKYCGYRVACDVVLGLFVITWFIARHVFYGMICWSVYTDIPGNMPYGCYDSTTGAQETTDGGSDVLQMVVHGFWNPGGRICFNPNIRNTFLTLLLLLHSLTIMWFVMIIRVAAKAIRGEGTDDNRSESGDDEEDEDIDERMSPNIEKKTFLKTTNGTTHALPVEEYVGVEELTFVRRGSGLKRFRKSGGTSSSISIPGHSEPKELLGRIGCDKPGS